MKLLKQLTIAFALTVSAASFSPAFAAGKIENATTAQVKESIQTALTDSQTALEGLKNGSAKDVVLQHIATARQATKSIEVGTTLDPVRSKASTQLRTANAAVAKDEKDKAETALAEAVKLFEEIKAAYK